MSNASFSWIGVFCNFLDTLCSSCFCVAFFDPRLSYILLYCFLVISGDTFSHLSIITLYLKFSYFPFYLFLFLGNRSDMIEGAKPNRFISPQCFSPSQRASTATTCPTSLQAQRREQRAQGSEGVGARTAPGRLGTPVVANPLFR